jgi:hypothetical protein
MTRTAVADVPRPERLQEATRVRQALTEAVCPQCGSMGRVSWDEAFADRYEEWSAEMTVDSKGSGCAFSSFSRLGRRVSTLRGAVLPTINGTDAG